MNVINEFIKQHGYVLTTKSSKHHEVDQIKACYLHCNCSGVCTRTTLLMINELRKSSENCSSCAILYQNRQTDKWLFEIKDPAHNHDRASLHTHPTLHQTEIKENTSQSLRISFLQISLHVRFLTLSNVKMKAISSHWTSTAFVRTSITSFLMDGHSFRLFWLHSKEGKWLFNNMKDAHDHIVGLFCIH